MLAPPINYPWRHQENYHSRHQQIIVGDTSKLYLAQPRKLSLVSKENYPWHHQKIILGATTKKIILGIASKIICCATKSNLLVAVEPPETKIETFLYNDATKHPFPKSSMASPSLWRHHPLALCRDQQCSQSPASSSTTKQPSPRKHHGTITFMTSLFTSHKGVTGSVPWSKTFFVILKSKSRKTSIV